MRAVARHLHAVDVDRADARRKASRFLVRRDIRDRRWIEDDQIREGALAHDAATGKPIWHSRVGNVSNASITYKVDGRQYLLVATGDTLYAFMLY